MKEQEFVQALKKQGLEISNDQLEQFRTYYHLLVSWNEKMNLTAITDEEGVYLKHFYDSLTVAFSYPLSDQSICDVGAGAGFPGIPLKIMYPELKLTIVDSLSKRITFLHHLIEALGLEDVTAIAVRAEDHVKTHREAYDIVMARAVAKLSILDELCLPLVKVGGAMIALKGRKSDEELLEAKRGLGILGGQLEQDISFTLSAEDDYRHNLIIRKVKPTPKAYPRAFGKIKKKPL
ncbi:MAG: 16S rRNA (guanine(527)-N(7))-methyltransferase RsmG [bacterium]